MTHSRFSRRALVSAFASLYILTTPLAPVHAAQEPEGLVTDFHGVLLDVMQNAASLGFQGRYARLEPAIVDGFHLPLMAQVAAGSYWRKASADQRERLIKAFTKVSVGTYASRFSGYSGQSFVTRGARPGPQKTRLVEAALRNPAGEDAALTYVTKEIRGRWRIIDVLLDTGISELAVRRSEYRRILKAGGADGLIDRLTEKAEKLAQSR